MKQKNQSDQNSRLRLYFTLGIVFALLLVSGLIIWLQNTNRPPAISTSNPTQSNLSIPTIQINIPQTSYPTIPPSAPQYTISIQSLNLSGITGTATFKDISGTVAILLHVDGLPNDEEADANIVPAELHHGTCTTLGSLAYPMSTLEADESETDLSISLKQFNAQKPWAIILFRSLQDHTALACGDIQ